MTAVVPGRLVVLDEPTNDLDPVRRRLLWAQIRTLADEGAAVLLVTHNVRGPSASSTTWRSWTPAGCWPPTPPRR